jgi:monoamine oxidase
MDVAEVALSSGGVRVRSTGGTSEEGSHVVVTVPLGVLKRGAPGFSPVLPPDRLAAIGRLGFGCYEKVVLRFGEPFWRVAGVPHVMIFPRDPGDPAIWVLGQDAFGAGPVLAFKIVHSAASHVLDASPDEAAQWALEMLAEATGGPCPAPTAVAVTSWATIRIAAAPTPISSGGQPGRR